MSKKLTIGQILKDNPSCADCQTKGSKWASVNFGVLVCTECSGVHRSLPSCTIKSSDDDFLPVELEFLHRFGNTKANEILEKNLAGTTKPNPKSAYGDKESYIRRKYGELAFAPNQTFPKLVVTQTSDSYEKQKRASMQILKQGFMSKQGNSYKSWKRRYFVLVEDNLSYYKSPGDATPLGVIQLMLSNVVDTQGEKSNTFKLVTPSRTYYFEADSSPEVSSWVEAIKGACAKLAAGTQSQTTPGVGTSSMRSGGSMIRSGTLPTQTAAFQEISGYLKKQGNSIRKDWKRRWFVLKPESLHYYKNKDDPRPVGCIHLLACSVKTAAQVGGRHCFEIATPNRSYYAIAENAEEMNKWMQNIRNATQLLLDSLDNKQSVSSVAPAPGQTAKEIAQVVAAKEAKEAAVSSNVETVNYPTGAPQGLPFAMRQEELSHVLSKKNLRNSLGAPIHAVVHSAPSREPPPVPPATNKSPRENEQPAGTTNTSGSSRSLKERQFSERGIPKVPLAVQSRPSPPTALLGEIQKGKELRDASSQPRPQSLKEGYMQKMGNNLIKDWPKRWCVLKDDCLAYYRDKKDQFPAGTIKLVTCHVKPNDKIKPLCIELITPNRSYFFCADDKTEQMGWINALSAACTRVMENFLDGQVPDIPPPPKSDSDSSQAPATSEGGTTPGRAALQGFLNKKGKNVFKEFKRRWCVLREDFMYYYLNEGDTTPLGVINLLLCTVKPMEQKGHYFEVILPSRSYYFQADSGETMYQWINAIRDRAVRLFNDLPAPEKEKTASGGAFVASSAIAESTESGGSVLSEIEQESSAEEPRELLKGWIADTTTGNDVCADCGTAEPRWASINLGIMVCIECSGIHRSLGTHISQVRSVDLDRWAMDTVQFMMTLGNKKANQIWEFKIPPGSKKPSPTDARGVKEEWINQKYVLKTFANPEIVSKEGVPVAQEKKMPSFFKEGYLTKQGNSIKTWKRRWFVLKVTQKTAFLFYYRNRGDPVAAGAIDLAYCIVRPATHRTNSFEIISPNRIYICVADTLPEMNSWLQKLKEVLDKYSKKDESSSLVIEGQ